MEAAHGTRGSGDPGERQWRPSLETFDEFLWRWKGKCGETPIVEATGAYYVVSLIRAIIAWRHAVHYHRQG
jgi:hypothetical protein